MPIHEQNYVRYDGLLRDRGAWRVIAWVGLRTYLGFLRTKVILLLLWIGPLIYTVMTFLEYVLRGQVQQMTGGAPPNPNYVAFFLQTQVFSAAILLMASGCGVVSEDLRHRTFQLYFSKPIRRLDYAIGKLASVFLLGSLISVVPALLVGGLRAALFVRTDQFKDILLQSGEGIGFAILFTFILSAVVVGLSSTTRNQGSVVLSFIGVIVVPQILAFIVAIAAGGAKGAMEFVTMTPVPAHLWSLTGNMLVVSSWALNQKIFDGPAWVAPIVLAAVTAAGLWAMGNRISRLEGVA